MDKDDGAFRTISEVADRLDIPQHVLRFWETRFSQIRPVKRAGGRRYYRPEDVALLARIKEMLYGQGFTIKGVQRILKEQAGRGSKVIGGGADSSAAKEPLAGLDGQAHLALGAGTESGLADARPLANSAAVAVETDVCRSAESGHAAFDPEITGRIADEGVVALRELLRELQDCARILSAARAV